ncbi:MAG: hypothetical protein ACTSXW_08515 [Candidatus Baldrarchaeia archaeon]
MGHKIKFYGEYKGVPIYRDFNIVDGEQVYIGNGQGCHTFYFKTVEEAKKFIDHFEEQLKKGVDYLGGRVGQVLIPIELCLECQCYYSYGTKEYKKYRPHNCKEFKEQLKKIALENTKPILYCFYWDDGEQKFFMLIHAERELVETLLNKYRKNQPYYDSDGWLHFLKQKGIKAEIVEPEYIYF